MTTIMKSMTGFTLGKLRMDELIDKVDGCL
jgi:hypothetical protein